MLQTVWNSCLFINWTFTFLISLILLFSNTRIIPVGQNFHIPREERYWKVKLASDLCYIWVNKSLQMINCTVDIPTCLATKSMFSNITFCNTSTIRRIVYNHEICKKGSVVPINNEDHFECFCTTIPINECRSNIFGECKSSTYIISSIQAEITVLGIILDPLSQRAGSYKFGAVIVNV